MKLGVVILAAGQGTRMRSQLPKVLHPLAGKPLLGHVLDTAKEIGAVKVCVVYGHGGERVRDAMAVYDCAWVEQTPQLGTGHAVMQAMPAMQQMDRVLVLYGDVPLISTATLQRLQQASANTALGLLTTLLPDPSGYGRIVRDGENRVQYIVEQADASEAQLEIAEINTGFLVADRARLGDWLSRIGDNNSKREYYLTDIVSLAAADSIEIATAQPGAVEEVCGINNRVQLAELERWFQRRQAHELMLAGTTIADPSRFDLRGRLVAGSDTHIDVNVVIEGQVTLAAGVQVGPNCVLRDCTIGADTQILANCVIEESRIGSGARIGPFARLRPDADLGDSTHIGNFVEIKKAVIGNGSKVNHLTYIGNAEIGCGVNVGAGTITCNYDGVNKHTTTIGDNAFIGANTALVAPVTIGSGANIGAGSTIAHDAPAGKLTLNRARQMTIDNWQRPPKK